MSITDTDIQHIQEKIMPLIGKSAWNVMLGEGSFITIEFGLPIPAKRPRGRPHGEWHLWIYCCGWYISRSSHMLIASEDEREKIENQIQIVNGLTLMYIDIRAPAFETTLKFSEDVNIHLFPVFSEQYEHWMLYTPDGHVLTIGPGTSWSYTLSSA